jgi:hypothetical protein
MPLLAVEKGASQDGNNPNIVKRLVELGDTTLEDGRLLYKTIPTASTWLALQMHNLRTNTPLVDQDGQQAHEVPLLQGQGNDEWVCGYAQQEPGYCGIGFSRVQLGEAIMIRPAVTSSSFGHL